MVLNIAAYSIVAILVVRVAVGILAVGREREPWGSDDALARLLNHSALIAVLVLLATRV